MGREEDTRNPPGPLLAFETSPSRKPTTTILFVALTLVSCIAVSTAATFSSSSSSSPNFSLRATARPLKELNKTVVIMISCDGFRFGYQFKTDTPNIHRLINNGVEAETGLIPVFPSATFPNHYSIATGLYPVHHGIIYNNFSANASTTCKKFNQGNHDPNCWLGEPLWETVVKNGKNATTYFWPGSETNKTYWNCTEEICKRYNSSVPFEERVNTVLGYFDSVDNVPDFMNLYFEYPDEQGHMYGPDDPQITEAIAEVDGLIGMLIKGLEERGVFEDVHIILLGDHGMVGTCDQKVVYLDDLADTIKIEPEWVQWYGPVFGLTPPSEKNKSEIVEKMNDALSNKYGIRKGMTVYLKEKLPPRLRYSESDRVPPIVGLLEEGFTVEQANASRMGCAGSHGYDNQYFSMRSIFIGHGPRFGKGKKVPSFRNVEIYNVVTSILNIHGADNDGNSLFPDTVLLPEANQTWF